MNESGEIFAYDPDNRPTEHVECLLCGATFLAIDLHNGVINTFDQYCPKCPENPYG